MHQIASFKTTFSKKLQLLMGYILPQTPLASRKHAGQRHHASFDRLWWAIFDFQNLPPPLWKLFCCSWTGEGYFHQTPHIWECLHDIGLFKPAHSRRRMAHWIVLWCAHPENSQNFVLESWPILVPCSTCLRCCTITTSASCQPDYMRKVCA